MTSQADKATAMRVRCRKVAEILAACRTVPFPVLPGDGTLAEMVAAINWLLDDHARLRASEGGADTAIRQLETGVSSLEAENQFLNEENQSLMAQMPAVRAENARLRKLLAYYDDGGKQLQARVNELAKERELTLKKLRGVEASLDEVKGLLDAAS